MHQRPLSVSDDRVGVWPASTSDLQAMSALNVIITHLIIHLHHTPPFQPAIETIRSDTHRKQHGSMGYSTGHT